MSLGLIDQLTHSTVRIETVLHSGGISTGTGFYMNFLQKEGLGIPVIVTNKHVVENANIGRFHVTLANDEGLPDTGKHQLFQFANFEEQCIKHPDQNIDLAAFIISPLVNKVRQSGEKLFYMALPMDLIPSDEERESYSSMEDIVMIGYPDGIWDAKNNLPVIRKGITATHANVSWNGNSEFLTDVASFPGSSGSPVFLANIGGYMDNKGNTYMGQSRIRLLGIHYAGAMHTAFGEIQIVKAPTSNVPVPITQIPNNIGVAINSKELFGLEKEVERIISANA
ncbi:MULTISPECIES: serine protease [unclassified Microcoleus]|uniref:S1 family peptidase n=1 Tax=unclassified Microcoleus TaxID=2642155 RepID=UPI001D939354|nr:MULTISPECIES: serine protease [unclassified Microcoleus]MCC3445073.1 trypsin-like peptidase domain-containing protein [Microcoleus sp. PH2017_03_ELD_O_A]MCC3507369.1 trypsin-like peptidase domain-containing protein [Microcoleus sp. PH2017_19_SFW_U_A]TAE05604.1 MAG: serine protease [Oscillatoriales cyanobacterium]MCC3494869.1 trypsin-like peptidase domain-containing protein [Microcoleus sp. PH2017_16_JOR_D_A]MCC3525455.1 trypsin-like peptidase domain-containing protein [Microcoleus sp. PH201